MDGRIGEKINYPVLDTGMPASGAILDSSSKNTDICPDVTPKLNGSASPVASPDRVRTVSSKDSPLQRLPHAFDFRFVASDDQVRQLLVNQTRDEHREVTLISHPDDLSQANLVSRLSISGDGHHTLYPGKLFAGSQPLTLVIDIRELTSEELPKFNDLLDPVNPCLYDRVSREKRPLGKHVSLLVVADPAQLASVGQCEAGLAAGAPGADFWRRINRPGNTWQFDAQTGNAQAINIDSVPPVLAEFSPVESTMDKDNTLVIDCHLHSHWRQLLLGGPGVDQKGRIQHLPGRLESLKAGQRVILKGANWKDLAFEQTIRQMLAQQSFESNGKICQLPDNVQFYQMPVGKDELHSLFQSLSHSYKEDDKGLDKKHAPRTPIIINENNIRDWLSPIAIAPGGYATPNTCLLEQVRAGGTVTVTSPLTEAEWFCLLGSLQTIRETTGLEPRLQVAHWKKQPKALGLTKNDEHPLPGSHQPKKKVKDHAVFNTFTYQQHAQASHWLNNQQVAPLVIQVNEQTSFSELFDNIHITSEQKAHFGRLQSKLQEALTAGEPVVFRGLESNPRLQQLLEPLVVGQPLLLNGQLQAYPQAHITLLWPDSAKSPSSVFRAMVAKGKPCLRVDLWGISASRHGIPRSKVPEQALDKLYEAFKTVPDGLCNALPEITEGLLNNLILAARRAKQVDQSQQLLPRHWRKAINSVITHGTRQNPSVRDFMKVACWHLLPDKDQAASVDPDQLTAIINSDRHLDREFVEQNLWPLARAFDPAIFKGTELQLSYKSPFPESADKKALDRLCAMILAHAPEQQRQTIAYQLEVDPKATEQYPLLTIRPARQIKRLQDALACGWHLPLSQGQIRSDAIQALANDCFHMARTANSEAERIERIENRLSESLKWQGSADMPLSALARDLYHGKMSQKDRESRRLSRLHDRLTDSPVIFLQGETGTGKSYFSAKMAEASGQAKVISLGPSDSEQTLMKRWQWQEYTDGDRSMVQQNRTLMEWATTPQDTDEGCVGGNYITLVLDEANLAKTGLLASLNGLWEPKPCIYVNGHPVPVSPKHRVILTGNSDHYSGRQLDPALKEKLPRAYYPRLDQAFLRDRVVEPALVNHLSQRHLPEQQINDIAHSATKSLMALWQYYQELLPEHEFTPRDLTDICSWVGWYLDHALSEGDSVSCEQVNSLIQQSFRDVLGPEISETQQDALSALEIWFAARYHPDNTLRDKVHNHTLPDIQRDFEAFTKEFQPEFDTSGSAVIELVQRLGQDLSRCQQAYHHDRKHGGRQATLIEGPAGRGKDATLNLMIESVRQQARQRQESMPEVSLLNACDCSWEKVCEAIQKAKVEGGIVVISEMNLIDSQHLEGELNDILAGDAHPGFHLFATINPPEYSGRKPLSPALKGRFRHLPIRQYNSAELHNIAGKVLPDSPKGKFVAKWLTEKHCRLRACLQRKDLPLQPTSRDLQDVAMAVKRGGDFSEKALHQCLNQHYRLYLMAANLSLEELPKSPALVMGKGTLDSGLCEWLNETVSGISRPWLIRRSDRNSIDEKHHEICFKTGLTEEKTKTEIIRMVAQAQWQASGLSLNPDPSDNTLTRALYRHWQQGWFDRKFDKTGIDANSVFPLTEAEEQTLKLPVYRSCLQEVDQRMSTWNANAVQYGSAFWHQMSVLPNQRVDDYTNKASAINADEAHEKFIEELSEKDFIGLERDTNYECKKKPKVKDEIVFKTLHHPSHMYRWWASDVCVSDKGNIRTVDINDLHFLGVETLTPDPLPGRDQEVILASNQTLATLNMSSEDGQYELPSLTPDDYIVALRIEPDLPYTLKRDKYTGLHTLFIPKANAKRQRIQISYVVESREPDLEASAKEARSKRSIRFHTRCSKEMKKVLNGLFTNIDQQPPEIQEPLRKIADAPGTAERIQAIKEYCRQFSGVTKPKRGENFFKFLVTQRQGRCRHRAPVFVALCRYFKIPCRQMSNNTHAFAECSVDRGQTWQSVDLGGAPTKKTKVIPKFQRTRTLQSSSAALKTFKSLLEREDLSQQQTLAKAMSTSPGKLSNSFLTNSALPERIPSTSELVKKLWGEKNLTSFAMGVSALSETKVLSNDDKKLLGTVARDDQDENSKSHNDKPMSKAPIRGHIDGRYEFDSVQIGDWEWDGRSRDYEPMAEAVIQVLLDNDEDQVTEQLESLYSRMIIQGGANPNKWLSSMVSILNQSELTKPSVINFALKAMESGWLDPPPNYDSNIIDAREHHKLLDALEGINELKVKATHCLRKWYGALVSREKHSREWRLDYEDYQRQKRNTLLVTHCHDGFSSSLENQIARRSIEDVWTNNPEGIPNIERMLVQQPAFSQLNSGREKHRPVIIIGRPNWSRDALEEKVQALLRRKAENRPKFKQILEKANQIPPPLKVSDKEKKILDDFTKKCEQAIRHAFSHYLYEVTQSKGGRLTYCWVDAVMRSDRHSVSDNYNYGAHDPSSPEELFTMMSYISTFSHREKLVKDAYLRQAHNASDALVLRSDELTFIAKEFLSSVNLNSISDSLDI
ncbi:AAA family ATPase [Endozoicomonas sp. 8E]|uniref:AAA family ATPase n=1 Tax=Endozoicomonas sp. 8E TaxID=3035692 RepID=UPI0029393126|nr:AAA family ATPase [Endozoicomonas sp. 8E]WOG28845.1 AAA family ATPase [Endozoicomonas sp. 8E]